MPESTTRNAELVAELNDLLELDHDAVGAYTVAIEALESEALRQDLIRFRGDHQRHVRDLTHLIRSLDGEPSMMPHLSSSPFKLAVQSAGAAGGDREILLAFKSNEGQVRNKYRRAAEAEHPENVSELLRRNASDEEVHYTWVSEALDRMGAGPDSALGEAEAGFERMHGKAADMMEGAERQLRRGASQMSSGSLLGTAVAVGLGLLVLRKILK